MMVDRSIGIPALCCILVAVGCNKVGDSATRSGGEGKPGGHAAQQSDGAAGSTSSAPTQAPSSEQAGSTGTVTNYEAPGNLESTTDVDCIALSSVKNSMTPADLYPAMAKCIKAGDYERAARLYAIAGTYARFDMMRVADRSAHQAKTVLEMEYRGWMSEEQNKKLADTVTGIATVAPKLSDLCQAMRSVGIPSYHPRYMIQHGMGAFTGQSTPDGLVVNFEPAKAWNEALDGYLHCPPVK